MSAAAGKPSRSASAIIASTASGYHLLKIDGYSRTKGVPTGERIKSRPFTLGGHRWYIVYHPNGSGQQYADCISLFLVLDEDVTTAVKAQHKFSFADELTDQAPSFASVAVHNHNSQQRWGNAMFMKRADLEKSKHLKDDCFTIRCDIVVISDYRAEDLPEETPPAFVTVAPSDLHQHLGDLLNTEKGADVVFEVGGHTFAAHRCVLAARSPVFSAELFGGMKEGDTAGVVRIDEMEAQVFKALLCFAYTDSLPVTLKEDEDVMCQHLLVAADRYNMERLKSICEEKLCKYINAGTITNILTLAEQHHCEGLKKACLSFLSSPANLRVLLDSDGFDHLSRSCPSVIKNLIAMSALV
ncbi:BTB/POZ and MATH domain-containing protein 1-like [Triticum dicoccoides]|uniref:BTB/POZ and MATH domain-containing protein 1-like n=1 Tax=Triticum dicoccoides TaxID=85692 RepID=UPI001233535C|nr:BTB/POZ and MATH domain-containing protein 1-like [Triticum dicoccoides]